MGENPSHLVEDLIMLMVSYIDALKHLAREAVRMLLKRRPVEVVDGSADRERILEVLAKYWVRYEDASTSDQITQGAKSRASSTRDQ